MLCLSTAWHMAVTLGGVTASTDVLVNAAGSEAAVIQDNAPGRCVRRFDRERETSTGTRRAMVRRSSHFRSARRPTSHLSPDTRALLAIVREYQRFDHNHTIIFRLSNRQPADIARIIGHA